MDSNSFEQLRQEEIQSLTNALEAKGGTVRFVSEDNTIETPIVISVMSNGNYKECLVVEAGLTDYTSPYVVVRDIENGQPTTNEQTYLYTDVMFSHLNRIADIINQLK